MDTNTFVVEVFGEFQIVVLEKNRGDKIIKETN
jgi:hypothetical protein